MNSNNLYQEEVLLHAYFTYDKDRNKVYDIKGMRKSFKRLIEKLK